MACRRTGARSWPELTMAQFIEAYMYLSWWVKCLAAITIGYRAHTSDVRGLCTLARVQCLRDLLISCAVNTVTSVVMLICSICFDLDWRKISDDICNQSAKITKVIYFGYFCSTDRIMGILSWSVATFPFKCPIWNLGCFKIDLFWPLCWWIEMYQPGIKTCCKERNVLMKSVW